MCEHCATGSIERMEVERHLDVEGEEMTCQHELRTETPEREVYSCGAHASYLVTEHYVENHFCAYHAWEEHLKVWEDDVTGSFKKISDNKVSCDKCSAPAEHAQFTTVETYVCEQHRGYPHNE